MEHDIREEGGCTVVALRGDVDLSQSAATRKLLLREVAAERGLFVELSGVTYIDSSGVATLVETYQAAKRAGQRFGLVSVSEATMRVLKLAHLDQVFPIHDSVADGLKHGA